MNHDKTLKRLVSALSTLNVSAAELQASAPSKQELKEIIQAGIFSPAEDQQMAFWFAHFNSVRNHLWHIVNTSIENTGGLNKLSNEDDWRYFVLSYSAVCTLIRMDRFLITQVAADKLVQRKLNEAFPEYRIERKQFTHILKNMVDPSNAIRIYQAHKLLRSKKAEIQAAVKNTPLNRIYQQLPKQERFLNLSKRHYLIAWLKSRKHTWKRRGASAKQKSIFAVMEYSGRLAAELRLPRTKKVNTGILEDLRHLLKPGDIFVTRHRQALTNLLLPGFWPHASLFIGDEHQRERLALRIDSDMAAKWSGDICTFEALKDGVHFRTLQDTLNVDAFVVLRPKLDTAGISQAISNALSHEGKDYNFDFDFFRSDQLVCTEVIFRGFNDVDGNVIPLTERMGRKTLSAEDLLDLSFESDWLTPLAIYGFGDSKNTIVTGPEAQNLIRKSYRG